MPWSSKRRIIPRHWEQTPSPEKRRMDEQKKRADASLMAAIVADDQLQVQRRLLKNAEKKTPEGGSSYANITVYAGDRLTHIEFEGGAEGSNISRGRTFVFPYRALYSLIVTNMGPGTLYVKTPETSDNLEADMLIKNNDSFPFTPGASVIKMLNMVATGSDCNVGLYMTW